jgi:hypothetical protein
VSDCPDCDNAGFIEEYAEIWDDAGRDTGYWYRLDCRNWRHRCGPSLEEIARALREGRDPPHMYMLPETTFQGKSL